MPARILIVEDEEPLTLLLRYNLEAAGYVVDSTARGDEAELKLRETMPDLVVLVGCCPAFRESSCAAAFARSPQPRNCRSLC